jgi:hypothetical protein
MDDLQFPNGIAVSPDNITLAIGDFTAGRMLYTAFAAGPTMGVPGRYTIRAASFSVPVPNGDLSTTNFAFGRPDNCDIFLEGAVSGTFWRFKAPFPGLIGPDGRRLPAQP